MNEQPKATLSEDAEKLVEILRGFEKAYPENVFGPVTQEREQHGGLISRNSAAMGRHCAKFMSLAADMIEKLSAPSEKS